MRLRISSRQPPTSGTPARRSHRHRHSTCTQVHLRKRYQGKVAGYAARQLIVRCGKIYPASDRTSSNRSKGQSHRQAHSRHWSHIYFLRHADLRSGPVAKQVIHRSGDGTRQQVAGQVKMAAARTCEYNTFTAQAPRLPTSDEARIMVAHVREVLH